MSRQGILAAAVAILACLPSLAQAQAESQKPAAPLARWIEVQNAQLSVRYRVADNSAGTVTTNQMQHREGLRARFKIDAPGRYAVNLGVSSGGRFTSGWNNTGVGIGDWQDPLAARLLFFAAQSIRGIEGQYGSMVIIKGESTELTTYDEDGYVIGERVSVRRPRELFFDELSATVGYLSSDADELGVTRRVKYLNDRPNYRHFLVDKKIGTRGGISTDFTSANGARTWRAAANINTSELRFADGVLVETYKRTNRGPDYGFAVSVNKALNRRVGLSWGYAKIDPLYGGLNSDRFNIGKRVFLNTAFSITPRFSATAFVTTAVGEHESLPQRNLGVFVFTYNVMPDIRRSGLF